MQLHHNLREDAAKPTASESHARTWNGLVIAHQRSHKALTGGLRCTGHRSCQTNLCSIWSWWGCSNELQTAWPKMIQNAISHKACDASTTEQGKSDKPYRNQETSSNYAKPLTHGCTHDERFCLIFDPKWSHGHIFHYFSNSCNNAWAKLKNIKQCITMSIDIENMVLINRGSYLKLKSQPHWHGIKTAGYGWCGRARVRECWSSRRRSAASASGPTQSRQSRERQEELMRI